ncbi:helix-turn-helix domain-containing protein [Pseudarthrobacter sp. N5]|uniref:helix-turn-helix domain-containing protein n=1 Tax=Pseudarthrobacter sp. N5 TaxID=3418416 RepID=UPI003CE79CC1
MDTNTEDVNRDNQGSAAEAEPAGYTAVKGKLPTPGALYTIDDLADIFQISRTKAYELMRVERWPHSKYGTKTRFEEADLEAIKAMHRQPAAEAPRDRRVPRIGTGAQRSRNRARMLQYPNET